MVSIILLYSAEWISLLMFLVCAGLLLLAMKIGKLAGLYVYNAIAIIASNIQVLQVSEFSLLNIQMALGTITFASNFLVSDIITEHYGLEKAKHGIIICFFAQLCFTLMMLISSLYKPALGYENVSAAIDILFIPAWRILVASIISYIISQYLDITIFKWIGNKTHGKLLWLRTFVATSSSGLVDSMIFSYIAWSLLSPTPIGFNELIMTYVLGSYIARFLVHVFSLPVIYLSYRCV